MYHGAQGQFMNSSDLAKQFSEYVTAIDPDYEVGTDDVVSKWVGKHTENSGGVEAELDIQFMMGVTPGIKTESVRLLYQIRYVRLHS